MAEKKRRMGLAEWVLIGAVTGILAGVLLGDYAGVLEPVGRAYIQLLAICVYPYVIASLLHGLGKLTPSTAGRLFKYAWPSYLVGWGITIASMMVLGSVFPTVAYPAVLNGNSVSGGTDLIGILIPGNPFLDLSKNAVPAVVVFALLYGMAIQRVEHKDSWLEILVVIKSASVTIWHWVVFVAPVGVFALLASTAGTMQVKNMAGMLLYSGLYIFGAFFLAFWVIPAFLASILPVTYREIMEELRGAFVLALVTTLSVAALPGIVRAAEKILEKCRVEDEMSSDVIGTNISIAYPLAQLGNLGVILFFYFAAFYFRVPLLLENKILLPFLTLLSTVGSPSTTVTAVPFLASVLHTPRSTLDLWIAPMAFTRYPQVALSVAGFALATLWPTLGFFKKMRVRPLRVAGILLITFTVLGTTVIGFRIVQPKLIEMQKSDYITYDLDPKLKKGLDVRIYREGDYIPPRDKALLSMAPIDRIRNGGTLRVGYEPVVIPFCYLNGDKQLVGYDVAHMYRLAKDMNVKLIFIPMNRENWMTLLERGDIDIAANGIIVTSERMRRLTVSRPYCQSEPALLARSTVARKLMKRSLIEKSTGFKAACSNSDALLPLANSLFNRNELVIVDSYDQLLTDPSIDCAVWDFIKARAFAMAHPGFTAVVPENIGNHFLFAYMMPPRAEELQQYIDHWIEICEQDGFTDKEYQYWIEGIPRQKQEQRWSIIKDVFHLSSR